MYSVILLLNMRVAAVIVATFIELIPVYIDSLEIFINVSRLAVFRKVITVTMFPAQWLGHSFSF